MVINYHIVEHQTALLFKKTLSKLQILKPIEEIIHPRDNFIRSHAGRTQHFVERRNGWQNLLVNKWANFITLPEHLIAPV